MNYLELLIFACLFTILGTFIGILTGLTPGLHVNTIAGWVLAFHIPILSIIAGLLSFTNPSDDDIFAIISVLLICCVIAHTFFDFILSIFLGVPDEDTALSVLPGHRLMLAGKGYEAVKCSALGSFGAAIFSIILIIPVRVLMGSPVYLYEKLWSFIPFILIIIVILLILTETATLTYRNREIRSEIICRTDVSESSSVKIKELRPNTHIKIVGRVSKIATENYFFITITDSTDEIGVWTDHPVDVYVGDNVVVDGIVVNRNNRIIPHIQPKIAAFGIFLLSGFLGYILFMPGIVSTNWYLFPQFYLSKDTIVLLPLFTGLFGLPTLLLAVYSRPKIPKQKVENVRVGLNRLQKCRGIWSGTTAGILVGFFPGITSSAGTVLAKLISGRNEESHKVREQKEFIIALSGVNTSAAVFTMLALFVIFKARSGVMHAIFELNQNSIILWEPFSNIPVVMVLMLIGALISAVISLPLVLLTGRFIATTCNKIPYTKICVTIIIFLIILIFLFSGILGLVIAFIATCIGLIPPLIGIKRIHLMGCLILPIILYFFGLV